MYHIGYVPAKLHTESFGDCDSLQYFPVRGARSGIFPHRTLEGEWHGIAPEVLAPVLKEFLTPDNRV
jgi:hypothetical protein